LRKKKKIQRRTEGGQRKETGSVLPVRHDAQPAILLYIAGFVATSPVTAHGPKPSEVQPYKYGHERRLI
jgi:hypothetical protein